VRAAARRFGLIFAGVVGGTAVLSLLIGLAAGSSARRALSVGFYVAGATLLCGALVMGIRGPLRPEYRDDDGQRGRFFGPRTIRYVTPDERSQSNRSSLFLFALGILLVTAGGFIDPREHI
jgi:hypothetical protein